MFRRNHTFKILLSAFLLVSCSGRCYGQAARYQPRKSTVSPYLNLGRFNGGGLPNYYALVRPQVQQRQFNAQAERIAIEQADEISLIQNDIQRGVTTAGGTGKGSWFMRPGTQSGFLNTSRYFPTPRIGGRRR